MEKPLKKKQPLLSICIPTYKRANILKETLHSIYNQNVDHSLFEVCVSDNSPTDETKELLEKEFSHIDNLSYKKSTCEGFFNSIEALRLGHGCLLKLHNDYSSFKEETLNVLISRVEKYQNEKPLLFFAMGAIRNMGDEIREYSTYDSFMKCVDFWSTWSSAFSIWKEDFDKLMQTDIKPDHMFPHTTLLFYMTDKSLYVVDNEKYVENLELKKKGGYCLPDNFVRIYLTMVEQDLLLPGHINKSTYDQIENNILKFTAEWYWNVKFDPKYSFTFDNYKEIIKDRCGENGYRKFEVYRGGVLVKRTLRKVTKSILNPILKKK